MFTILRFFSFLNTMEKKKVVITLPVIEKYVLMIALTWALPEARLPLKLGQNSHRNKVPGWKQ